MKRYLKFILLLALLPVFIKAHEPSYCTEEEYKKELKKISDVLAAPVLVDSTKEYTDYKIEFNEKFSKDRKKADLSDPNFYQNYDKKYSYTIDTIKSPNIEITPDRLYRVYGKKGTKEKMTFAFKLKPSNVCYPEKLKNIEFYLLYVNPYAKDKRCTKYPDFEYCGKNVYLDKEDKEVDALFDKYIKEKETKKVNNKVHKKEKLKIKNYDYRKLICIISIVILLLLISLILKKSKNKNIYLLLLILLIPLSIKAWDENAKNCSYSRLKMEREDWCRCMKNLINNSQGSSSGIRDDQCHWGMCRDCIGMCYASSGRLGGSAPNIDGQSHFVPIDENSKYSDFCPANGKGGAGMPPVPPIYCCYYKGKTTSKYRYFNETENKCDKPNMEAKEVEDPSECTNTYCSTYGDINDKEEFCNEFADTKPNSVKAKRECIIGSGELECSLPISVNDDNNPSCNYKSSSYGGDVFSAKGRKTRVKAIPYESIYLKETCDYEENLEMRSMGSRYAFVNTLNISNGRNCKYKIYNEKGILQNLMATVFRPGNTSMSCENNKYCKALQKFKDNKLGELLKGNETGYTSKYAVTGIKGNGSNIFKTYDFKTGDTLKAQSQMSKPKEIGEYLNLLSKEIITNVPYTKNIERETTAVTGVTLNMQESCYNFPNNRLGSGECFPAFFSDQDIREVRTNASFNTEGKFLCQGVSKGAYYPSPKNPVDTCTDLDDGLTSGAGVSSDNGRSAAQIGNSEYCEIIVHGHKCDLSPNSNVYDLSYGYRAGLKIRTRFKAKYFNISNECVSRSNTEGMRKSTLKGYKNHIYGGLIDDKGMFYSCKVTLIDGICPPACIGKNCGGGPDGKKCEVNRSGNTYTISSPGINFEKDGLYARKGGRFEESEFRDAKSPDNLKVWRIYENKITSEKSKYIDYYNDNVVRMSEPGVNHPIYFMVCPNNNCHNPYLCDSYYIDKTTDLKDPEDPELDKEKPSNPDCITDLEYNERQNADSVRAYCEANFANEYGTDKTLEACLNKCYTPDNATGEAEVYRRIKYSEPFPNNRTPGWNWFGREALISQSANFVKTNNKNPLWVITLRQSDSYSIRNNNRSAGYDVYSEVPETQGNAFKIYRSKFLESDLRDVKKNEKKLGN